ncbi:glycosyltransferase [Terrabacter sp. C0L_2]|uniref:glycosyltransferase n=1 Tax=Terrabacter sp. C0L_2 TaxID=3108389 RepID=UPI002ED36121|nr:glycosyltransferase [Terrabacter sp. C0L_2]
MDVGPALATVSGAPTILEGLRAGRALTDAAAAHPDGDAISLLAHEVRTGDPLTAIAAVQAMGATGALSAAKDLTELLADERGFVAEHAVDALRHVPPVDAALPTLVRACHDGGFTGMLAQRTLERWAAAAPDQVRAALTGALPSALAAASRARLVETLGLVPGAASTRVLIDLAGDDAEPLAVRTTALAALGDGPAADRSAEPLLVALTRSVGPLARTARLALHDLSSVQRGSSPTRPRATATPPTAPGRAGLTIAQLFLHSDIDGQLNHSGQGDTGGIATLLVHLGDALLRQPGVGRVITISGGTPDPAHFPVGRGAAPLAGQSPPSGLLAPGHHYAHVPRLGAPLGVAQAWPTRVSTRRGIRRILRAAGHIDAIHLRMADVGSMAAAEAAAELGIPVVLTLAPDPHALIEARDTAGTLTRTTFGEADLVEHLWFRDRLLLDLADQADHLVLFPRPNVERDLHRFLGLDLTAQQATVVGEGIDVSALDRVVREVRDATVRGPAVSAAVEELGRLLARLPAERRDLPVVVSVGRLNAVKGMATLVRAWREDPELAARCNVLVVGGDLDQPNDDEAAELARIHAVVPADDATSQGLLLAGHRPNATATAWLAALGAAAGAPGSPRGVYVSASLKEEFGIAILEAMAAGLVVVAPAGGGPATYVAQGETGILTDTSSAQSVAAATRAALDLAASPDSPARVRQAQDMIHARFGIDTMAAELTAVYRRGSSRSVPGDLSSPVAEEGAS